MTGVFKTNSPSNIFLLFIYGLLLKIESFLPPQRPLTSPLDGYLYKWMMDGMGIQSYSPYFLSVISYLLIFSQALFIHRVAVRQRMFPVPNYLPAMSFLLITSLFPAWNIFSSQMLANTLMISFFSMISRFHNSPSPRILLFNSGLVLALTSLFYFPAALFLLLVPAGLILTRPFVMQEWIAFLMGLLTPYYLLFAFLFIQNGSVNLPWQSLTPDWTAWAFDSRGYISLMLVCLCLILGIFYLQVNFQKLLVQTRNNWLIIFLFLMLGCLLPFMSSLRRFDQWLPAVLPASMIISAAFYFPERKILPHLLHWSIVAAALALGYVL